MHLWKLNDAEYFYVLCCAESLSTAWDSPGKNIGLGCDALLKGIVPTQGSSPGLPH